MSSRDILSPLHMNRRPKSKPFTPWLGCGSRLPATSITSDGIIGGYFFVTFTLAVAVAC
jgi:hypothetical protein